MKNLQDIKNIQGKRVLLRLDLNVPVIGDAIRNDFRIRRILPTLAYLKEKKAKTIIVSHIGDDNVTSLEPVIANLSKLYTISAFVQNIPDAPTVISKMQDGDIIALENIRKDPGEKENSPRLAAFLASLADIYVNDAFSVCHREHASIVGVPRLIPSYAGLLLQKEIAALTEAFKPPRPFMLALAGAKFDTKLPLVEKFIDIADDVFIGGALANDIFKDKGYEVGISMVSSHPVDLRSVIQSPKLILPSDVVVENQYGGGTKSANAVSPYDRILDAGIRTTTELGDMMHDMKFVVWNGPLGDYERGFSKGTIDFGQDIIDAGTRCVVGGGDTIAVLDKAGMLDKFSFVSTGGGAMIEFLAQGTLPGIEALDK
ncbi:MAG TPA: phosphoglycerate kinase [Candidatus Paceibacterota bacterium]|nr:phosphoglycerate kinase [Candidatus Paceibacterota bacterium]